MARIDAHLSNPAMNRPGTADVPREVPHTDPNPPQAARTDRRRPRRAKGSLKRSLTASLALHSALAVLIGGVSAGVAYQRRAGEESSEGIIIFARAPAPEPSSSLEKPKAEPQRSVENTATASEPEPTPIASDEPAIELPLVPASEIAAETNAANAAEAASALASLNSSNTSALDRAIGDPRASWRLPGVGVPGLQVGAGTAPPVSDCCGEPQPGPARAPAAEVYIYNEVLKMARADFPEKSQRMGEEGSVLLEMTVGADGLVEDVRVVESSGHLRIDNCAVAAARDWIFKPATRNGVAEASLARHRYTFRLLSGGG